MLVSSHLLNFSTEVGTFDNTPFKIFIGLFVLNFTIVATYFLLQLEMQPYTAKNKFAHYFLMYIFIGSFLWWLEICSLLFAHPWIFSPTFLECKGEIQNDTD